MEQWFNVALRGVCTYGRLGVSWRGIWIFLEGSEGVGEMGDCAMRECIRRKGCRTQWRMNL